VTTTTTTTHTTTSAAYLCILLREKSELAINSDVSGETQRNYCYCCLDAIDVEVTSLLLLVAAAVIFEGSKREVVVILFFALALVAAADAEVVGLAADWSNRRYAGLTLEDNLDLIVDLLHIGHLGALGQLAVEDEIARLLGGVLVDDVTLSLLVVAKTDQDDVHVVNPHLLLHFSTDVTMSFNTIKAAGHHVATTKHLGHLCVLLTVLLEDEFTLVSVIFVLSTATVLSSPLFLGILTILLYLLLYYILFK